MKKSIVYLSYAIIMIFIVANNMSCKKDDPVPPDPCAGKTIIITATPTSGEPNGSINVSATGSTGFMYKLNSSGTYQASGTFSNIAPGTYTVFAKDGGGCEQTKAVTLLAASDPCAAKSITVNATSTGVQPCGGSTGSINVSATGTGSTGFVFRLNTGVTYQSSGTFSNVAAGTYTVFAKDADGCENNTTVTVGTAAAGPLFTQVKNLISAKCTSCHNSSNSSIPNWTDQCNVIQRKNDIKSAVDANIMPKGGPALSDNEKELIADWINAGGGYAN